MTTKDLISSMSTLGAVLRMMGISADALAAAAKTQRADQKIGERCLELGVITEAELERALDLQRKVREARNIDEVEMFFAEVRATEKSTKDAVRLMLPPDTQPG